MFSDQMRTPTLLLNSEDDLVCLSENIRDDIVRCVSSENEKYFIEQTPIMFVVTLLDLTPELCF